MSYRTNRIPVAAYLIAVGADAPLYEMKHGRCEFVFDDPEGGVEWTAQEFDIEDEHAAMVSAPKFFNALRKLRREISEHTQRNN